MIELAEHAEGVILPVKAQPRASRDALRGEVAGMLKVSVTQVAEKGKANQAILDLLADALALRRSQITLLSGDTQPQKRFLIRGLTVPELAERIAAALADK